MVLNKLPHQKKYFYWVLATWKVGSVLSLVIIANSRRKAPTVKSEPSHCPWPPNSSITLYHHQICYLKPSAKLCSSCLLPPPTPLYDSSREMVKNGRVILKSDGPISIYFMMPQNLNSYEIFARMKSNKELMTGKSSRAGLTGMSVCSTWMLRQSTFSHYKEILIVGLG